MSRFNTIHNENGSTSTSSPMKTVSIMCIGSRGDFQPYLGLALELKASGYNVRLLSVITYQKFAQEFGIDFVNIKDDCFDKWIYETKKVRDGMGEGNMFKLMSCLGDSFQKNAPFMVKAYMNDMEQHRPDLFVYGGLCEYFGFYSKHVLQIPTMEVRLQAFIYNPKRALMGMPTLPFGLHYYLIKMGYISTINDWSKVNDKIMGELGSTKLSDVYSSAEWKEDAENMILGNNEIIVCQPKIFRDILAPNASTSVTYGGPLFLNAKEQTQSNSTSFGGDATKQLINDFINLEPNNKPVYLGWGSMICKSPEHMIKLVVSAVQICDERAIVLGGTAELSLDLLKQSTTDNNLISFAEENILFVKKAAHEDLFPKVKCIVHHGGSGTTNASLRSGTPSIITPVFGDQFDHAYVLNELGIGYGFSTQLQKIKAAELSKAISDVLGNETIKENAEKVGNEMRKEDGNKAVVEKLIEFMNRDTESMLKQKELRKKLIER